MPKALSILTTAEDSGRILRCVAERVDPEKLENSETQTFIDDMFETCLKVGLVGLAAPQVGKSLRIIIVASRPGEVYPDAPLVEPFVMINPIITTYSELTENGWEGCGSVKNSDG